MFFSIGSAICKARKNAGISVNDMVKITGVSKRSIYRYEQGVILPSLEYVIYMSTLCSKSIDELVGLSDNIP